MLTNPPPAAAEQVAALAVEGIIIAAVANASAPTTPNRRTKHIYTSEKTSAGSCSSLHTHRRYFF